MKKKNNLPPRIAPADSPWRDLFLKGWHPYAWLALVFLLYWPALSYQIILLDDNVFFWDRLPYLRNWANFFDLFRRGDVLGASGTNCYYRPLLIASMMLDVHWGGTPLAACHFSNVAYHFLASALVFAVFKRAGYKDRGFLLAMIFAFHPLQANAVAWINGRTDSFLAVFVLASFYCYQRYLAEEGCKWMLCNWLFFGLGLLSKELAAVVPAACLSYAFLVGPRPKSVRLQSIMAAGWLALLAAWHLARKSVSAGDYTLLSTVHSVFINLPAAVMYWGKIFLPVNLSTYPIMRDARLSYGIIAAMFAGVALLASRASNLKTALWGLAWFIFFLLPSFVYPASSITPVFFEYRAYLPMIGALVLLAEFGAIKAFDLSKTSHIAAAAALIVVLAAATRADSSVYRDSLAAWSSAVAHCPHSAFARKQLGTVYYLQKDYPRADAEYRKSLTLNPAEPLVHNNLGLICMHEGRYGEAESYYLQELDINPRYDNALFNLGLLYYSEGRLPQAQSLWERTLQVNADHVDACRDLALLHAQRGDIRRARYYAEEMKKRGAAPPF